MTSLPAVCGQKKNIEWLKYDLKKSKIYCYLMNDLREI